MKINNFCYPLKEYAEKIYHAGPFMHKSFPESYYAIDFRIPLGTAIMAAKAGRIAVVKNDSDEYGSDVYFSEKANLIAICHQDGTYTEYIHLMKGSIKHLIGDEVREGDIIGYSGLSGYMDEPHLHFNAFIVKDGKGLSIPAHFNRMPK